MDNQKRAENYFKELDRSLFMNKYRQYAQQDAPFPIGHGQTISQPSLVLKMTQLLDVDENSKVLEIGTGSGYQAALLAGIAGEVYTVERIEELFKEAKKRLLDLGYKNIKFKLDDGSVGWEEYAPYDRIMVTASADKLPQRLIDQLAPNGKMVIPVGKYSVQDLLLISKDIDGEIEKELIEKVRFVRLIGKY